MQLRQLLSYLGIPKIIYQTTSSVNGRIKVISQFGKNSISVSRLTQSGPIIEGLFKYIVRRLTNYNLNVRRILILGVAGGSAVKILRQYFPQAKITGIEIDAKMIEIGKRFFNLDKYQAKIIIQDVFIFIDQLKQKKYDLIIVDLLLGRKIPQRLREKPFLVKLKHLLGQNGIVIFNRLRIKKRSDKKFLANLKKVFPKIKVYKPLINTLIFAKTS